MLLFSFSPYFITYFALLSTIVLSQLVEAEFCQWVPHSFTVSNTTGIPMATSSSLTARRSSSQHRGCHYNRSYLNCLCRAVACKRRHRRDQGMSDLLSVDTALNSRSFPVFFRRLKNFFALCTPIPTDCLLIKSMQFRLQLLEH